MRGLIERRLQTVLGRFDGQVTVDLADPERRARGCRQALPDRVQLLRSGQVLIEGTNANFGAVVNRAMDRIGQSVRQQLERRRNRRRWLATTRGHLVR